MLKLKFGPPLAVVFKGMYSANHAMQIWSENVNVHCPLEGNQ